MSEMPAWTCDLRALESGQNNPWYVGTRLAMHCEGESLEKPFTEYAQVDFSPHGQDFALKIMELRQSTLEKAQFVVIPYRAGQFSFKELELSDGEVSAVIKDMTWNIPSVFEKKELQGQPRVPYGPYGPLSLSLPWWFYGAGIALLVVIGILVAQRVRKHLQRKRLREALAKHNTALSPYNQFQKDLRQIQRKVHNSEEFLEELDESFRLFLVRQLYVPAMEWSTRDILQEIKKRHRKLFVYHGQDLRRVLKEFEKAKSDRSRVSLEDCEQLAHMSRRLSEHMRKTQKGAR